MKTTLSLLLGSILILLVAINCESDSGNTHENTSDLTISGILTSHSVCKNEKAGDVTAETPDTLSCIDYSYTTSDKVLMVTHINAGFNCCPDSLYCTVSTNDDTIIIEEFEKIPGCHCNCLYDLYFQLDSVAPRLYQLKIIEPYLGEQDELTFSLDLTGDAEGSHCVVRKQYPWGESLW